MTTVRQIFDFIDSIAPFDHKMEGDPVGLLIGSFADKVSSVLLALDATPDVINEAAEIGAQLIITHHPVIYRPLTALLKGTAPYLAAKHNLSVISAHTNLDMAAQGVNKQLALLLELENINVEPDICMATGEYKKPVSSRELALLLKDKTNARGVRFTDVDRQIKRVAVTGGNGSSNVPYVIENGFDAFVTGELPHHAVLDLNNAGIAAVDGGHFKTEDIVITPLIKMLKSAFPEITFTKSQVFDDNLNYVVSQQS